MQIILQQKGGRAISGIVAWMVIGLVAGWLTGLIVQGSGYSLIGDILIGIIGGVLGGYLASLLFDTSDPISGLNIGSIVTAFLGSVILVMLVRVLRGRSPT